jgi:hypothetical protein
MQGVQGIRSKQLFYIAIVELKNKDAQKTSFNKNKTN